MSVERRDTFRVRPATREPIRVELVASGMLERGHVTDISEGGIGVLLESTASMEWIGLDVELVIRFPGTPSVLAKGVVRRVRLDGGWVLGIQFVALPTKALDAIRAYVTGRGQRHSGKFRVG
jgi:c-di-GMP-binding flagellar brake protein YcgR